MTDYTCRGTSELVQGLEEKDSEILALKKRAKLLELKISKLRQSITSTPNESTND